MNFRKTFEDALGVGAVLNNLPSKKKWDLDRVHATTPVLSHRVTEPVNRAGKETKSADPRWPVYRSGPARGPNPIRTKGSTCAPPPSSSPSLLPDSELGTRSREGRTRRDEERRT